MQKNIITKQLSRAQEELLWQSNIPFECVPVLDFKVAFNAAKAAEILATPNAVWVFTSLRAARALGGFYEKAATPAKIFTVGRNAADELAKHGYKADFVGNISEDLLEILATQKEHPILYFRGRHYRSSIPDFCAANEMDFHAFECYHSIKLPPPENLADSESIWVFSPLSAQAVSEWKGVSKELPFYSIGPVTDTHLAKLGFKNIKSPEVPSFENMVKLFLKTN
ncbi:MAG: uroporphyrinogen-III synthase [Saprospiraceae bacterium]|nr:uroporphyrinogen-III synthase [Saprospiraceae bacterium]